MNFLLQYRTAELIEAQLGDPSNTTNTFSFHNCVALDENEQYPTAIIDLLNSLNIHHYFIPITYGGKLSSFEEVLAIGRVIARRDLTVAIAFGVTYLGALPVWIEGTEKQKKWLATEIKSGKKVSFALTEKERGSDILASETEATKLEDGYLLSGTKWLIGNVSKSSICTVFAKIDRKSGPRSFSLFLINKDELKPGSYYHLPKIKTLGLRGGDISGISFSSCPLPQEAILGKLGSGLELALKTLQITRTLHAGAALSLGQADTALRATLSFACQRKLYKETVWDIPQVKQTLVESFLNILICECLSIATVRAIHASTEQMSLFSSIVKSFVPTQIDCLIYRLSGILGARCFIRENHYSGYFQKIIRDHAIVSIFDGNVAVNLQSIVLQLKKLTSYRQSLRVNPDSSDCERQSLIFDLLKPLPKFDPCKLELYNRGHNDFIQDLESIRDRLELMIDSSAIAPEVLNHLAILTDNLIEKINSHDNLISKLDDKYTIANSKSPELFAISEEYSVLHSAAACLKLWFYNRDYFRKYIADGEWLVLCLTYLLKPRSPYRFSSHHTYITNCSEEIMNLYNANKLFSVIEFQLSGSTHV